MNHLKGIVKELRGKIAQIKRNKQRTKITEPKTKYCYRYNKLMLDQCEVCEYCPDPDEEVEGEKSDRLQILMRSNVVQLDDMGYPLRLCIVKVGRKTDQVWIDTVDEEGDVVLKWTGAKIKETN